MSLEDIRRDCSDVAALLQPYVDGELQDDEQEKVGEHLEACSACRAAVTEQAWVRATLQSIERERAPQALRARVLQGLDEVDREAEREVAATQQAPPGAWARAWGRIANFGRGGLIMVPAGAVAVGLYFVAQQGAIPGPETDEPTALAGNPASMGLGSALIPGAEAKRRKAEAAADAGPGTATEPAGKVATKAGGSAVGDEAVLRELRALEPRVGFAPQVADSAPAANPGTPRIELVSADLDEAEPSAPAAARLRYELTREGRRTGEHLIDRQLPREAFSPRGTPVMVGEQRYLLHRDEGGAPVLHFEVGGIVHVLALEPAAGAAVPRAPGVAAPPGTPPDYALLLHLAQHLQGR